MSGRMWRRMVALSGPSDTLDDRWQVRRSYGRWVVVDLSLSGPDRTITLARSWRTMGAAREWMEANL